MMIIIRLVCMSADAYMQTHMMMIIVRCACMCADAYLQTHMCKRNVWFCCFFCVRSYSRSGKGKHSTCIVKGPKGCNGTGSDSGNWNKEKGEAGNINQQNNATGATAELASPERFFRTLLPHTKVLWKDLDVDLSDCIQVDSFLFRCKGELKALGTALSQFTQMLQTKESKYKNKLLEDVEALSLQASDVKSKMEAFLAFNWDNSLMSDSSIALVEELTKNWWEIKEDFIGLKEVVHGVIS